MYRISKPVGMYELPCIVVVKHKKNVIARAERAWIDKPTPEDRHYYIAHWDVDFSVFSEGGTDGDRLFLSVGDGDEAVKDAVWVVRGSSAQYSLYDYVGFDAAKVQVTFA